MDARDRPPNQARRRPQHHPRATEGRCTSCGSTLSSRIATARRPFTYRIAGHDVTLAGLKVHRCRSCGRESADVPRIDRLHAVIASRIVDSPEPLTGQELRFLRTTAGLAARDFAVLLGVSPEHLSRVENGHTATLGLTTDRLARAIVLAAGSGEARALRATLLDPERGRGAKGANRRLGLPACSYAGTTWHAAA